MTLFINSKEYILHPRPRAEGEARPSRGRTARRPQRTRRHRPPRRPTHEAAGGRMAGRADCNIDSFPLCKGRGPAMANHEQVTCAIGNAKTKRFDIALRKVTACHRPMRPARHVTYRAWNSLAVLLDAERDGLVEDAHLTSFTLGEILCCTSFNASRIDSSSASRPQTV